MSRALVLSGGGSVGIGWQTGIAAGLASEGVDLAEADFIVGTSAGSVVGAQIALGRDMGARLERYRNPPPSEARPESARSVPPERLEQLMKVMADPEGDTDDERRASIGRFALEAETGPEDAFVDGFSRLASGPWPARYVCTAVNAQTGEFKVWDAETGVPLERAVASSCCVPGLFPPVTIGDARYIDGGMRSVANLDLAAGHEKVLLITLMSGDRPAINERMAEAFKRRAEAERKAVTDAGGTIEVIAPDADAAKTMGINLMDASLAGAAAEAGFKQGTSIASAISAFWQR